MNAMRWFKIKIPMMNKALFFVFALLAMMAGGNLFAEETAGVTSGDNSTVQNRRQEFKQKMDRNQDGKLDQFERQRAKEIMKERLEKRKQASDNDNNPPGMKGGPGTNWENRPGPQGGPGAGPNRGGGFGGNSNYGGGQNGGNFPPRRDFDNNPPGMKGGPGTNWENRPGPQGGSGAGPNRKK